MEFSDHGCHQSSHSSEDIDKSRSDPIRCIMCKNITSQVKGTLIERCSVDFVAKLTKELETKKKDIPTAFDSRHYLCDKCYNKLGKQIKKMIPPEIHNDTVDILMRTKASANDICFVCQESQSLTRLPEYARLLIYIENNLYLRKGIRCCSNHLENIEDLIKDTEPLDASDELVSIERFELSDFMEKVRQQAKAKNHDHNVFDFSVTTKLSDEDFTILTGLSRSKFEHLCEIVVDQKHNEYKCTRNVVAMFLMKLRQNLTDNFLKIVFHYETRQSVSRMIEVARNVFMREFVPKYLGPQHISREDFIAKHNTELANLLYFEDDARGAILVVDGTYVYIEKSSNYTILKRSFCVHKGRHLLKPTMVVATNGYILDVIGPYLSDGKNNDAKILKHHLQTSINGLKEWLRENDIFLLDRGYRDAIQFLEDMGILTHMPALKKTKQFTVEEANETRLVTIQRWIVEKRNGDVKQIWKFLDGVIKTAHLLNIGDFFKIGCALLNAYYPTVSLKSDPESLSHKLMQRGKIPNKLMDKIKDERLETKRKVYKILNKAQLAQFPKLLESDLREITLGIYQLKQAKSYIAEKYLRDGEYDFKFYDENEGKDKRQMKRKSASASKRQKEAENLTVMFEGEDDEDESENASEEEDTRESLNEKGIIRAILYSRHSNAKEYKIWIQYDRTKDGSEAILGWYCSCPVGPRTVGCCSHVAATLWWLGLEQFTDTGPPYPPSQKLLETVLDAADRTLPTLA